MKKKLSKAALILTPVILVCLALFVVAAPGGGQGRGTVKGKQQGSPWGKGSARGENIRERMAEKLELTDEQQEKIDEIRYEADLKKIDIRPSIEKARLELRRQMDKDDIDKNRVLDLTEDIGKWQTEIRKIDIAEKIDIHNILTPEQREKADKLKNRFRAFRRRQEAGEHGEGRHGPMGQHGKRDGPGGMGMKRGPFQDGEAPGDPAGPEGTENRPARRSWDND